jgi:hypothetical protein
MLVCALTVVANCGQWSDLNFVGHAFCLYIDRHFFYLLTGKLSGKQ